MGIEELFTAQRSVTGEQISAPPSAYDAIINTTPATVDDEVMVTIEGIDGGLHEFGPCRWSPRKGPTYGEWIVLPQKGDEAIVMFTDQQKAWIVEWWPVS